MTSVLPFVTKNLLALHDDSAAGNILRNTRDGCAARTNSTWLRSAPLCKIVHRQVCYNIRLSADALSVDLLLGNDTRVYRKFSLNSPQLLKDSRLPVMVGASSTINADQRLFHAALVGQLVVRTAPDVYSVAREHPVECVICLGRSDRTLDR